jgi:DNA-directed RNA polymerase specialized sigma24 family protein
MRGEPEALYDAHAARLYAYCWSLVGDQAAAAVADAFAGAVQHPPRGDTVLWMYALARHACVDRGALDRAFGMSGDSDPLLRAASTLRADHREVLFLYAGEWLELNDIARVLGIAPDTVRQLMSVARTRLERAVLDTLMRRPGETGPHHLDVIAAFEKGTLPQLLARRAPARPPEWLRDHVLAAVEGEQAQPMTALVAPNPVVVIGSEVASTTSRRRRLKGFGAVSAMAASVAAAIGMIVAWQPVKGGDAASLVPTSGKGNTESTSGQPAPRPNQDAEHGPGSGRITTPSDQPGSPDETASTPPTQGDGGGSGGGPSRPAPSHRDPSKPGSPDPTDPSDPGAPPPPQETTPPPSETPSDPPSTTPPTEDPPSTNPPTQDPPSETPSDPPTSGSPSDTPAPSPTSNPTPSPGER